MFSLEKVGKSCRDCSGKCCTFTANSMQTTPLETLEVVDWLESENRIDLGLVELLKDCVRKFRLDQEISTGKGTTFRRTYTCPFFKNQNLGCSIAPEVKPYGCLGFNPDGQRIRDGENCSSNIPLLEKRERRFSAMEAEKNSKIKNELSLTWDKSPFPLALLDVMERLDKLRRA